MINKTTLKLLDLSENEIEIYGILLTKGETGIREILCEVKLKRQTLYNILNSLKEKYLIDEGKHRGKKTFLPKSPIVLENLIDSKIKSLESEKKSLKNNLPDLMLTYKLARKIPLVANFKGLEGLKKIYEQVLITRKTLYIFTSYFDRQKKEFSNLIDKQIIRQKKLNIKVKSLGSIDEYSQKYWLFAKAHGIEIRVTDKKFIIPAQILIFGNNIAYTSFQGEFVSTLINNPAIAESMKTVFENIWQKAKKPKIIYKKANKYEKEK